LLYKLAMHTRTLYTRDNFYNSEKNLNWGSRRAFYHFLNGRDHVSNLDFEKCLSLALNHYEGAIFGGVRGVIIQRDDKYVF